MGCLSCGSADGVGLCSSCRLLLRPAPERPVPGVGVVRSAFRHEGPARHLVHRLKYRGVVLAGAVLAEAMAPLVPEDAVIVPVVRVGWRRVRYGVDPALELSVRLGRLTGRPVARVLTGPWWGRARAGGVHGSSPRFRLRRSVDAPVVVVDDVVTTGATLSAAARLFPDVVGGVTATTSVGCHPRVLRP